MGNSANGIHLFRGRATRGDWWIWVVFGGAVSFWAHVGIFAGMMGLSFEIACAVSGIITSLLTIPVEVRRWHDLNQSGWLVLNRLLVFVPTHPVLGLVFGLVVFVFLGFIRGTQGKNRYGEEPPTMRERAEMRKSVEQANARRQIAYENAQRKIAQAKKQAAAERLSNSRPGIFSLYGRATRGEWWLTNLAIGMVGSLVVLVVLYLGLSGCIPDSGCILDRAGGILDRAILLLSILFLLSFIVFLVTMPVEVRRWHDLNQSGLLTLTRLLYLVPILGAIVGLIVFVFLGFIRGTRGKNAYGEDPLGGTEVVAAAKNSMSVKERLSRLDELKASGLVGEEEYSKKHAAILADL